MLIKNKKKIPYLFASIRGLSFMPMILSTFNILPLSFASQLFLSAIIMFSDKFDGEISRKHNNEKEKLKFRITDTVIDKLGIGLCLLGLLLSGKISIYYAAVLFGYNSILLGAGAVNLAKAKEKNERTVQGLFFSRLFTGITGLSFLYLNNFKISSSLSHFLTIGMAILGSVSLGSQALDKIKQKRTNKNKGVKVMNVLNVMLGMSKSKSYLKKLEKSICSSYKNVKDITDNSISDLREYETSFVDNIETRMENVDNYFISDEEKHQAYQVAMQGDARRIRPLLLFLGSLCSSGKVDKTSLVSSGVSIEMIHKMSLILDDYFDEDLMRRGHPTFHTMYDERMIIEITKRLLDLSNNIFLESIHQFSLEKQKELLNLYKQIIMDMGNGFIEDLDRNNRKVLLSDAYRINDLQSTTILRNSLLIGYTLGNKSGKIKDSTYFTLQNIGNFIGKTFQGFNDVENFVSESNQMENKGRVYSDLKQNRKNIILAKVPEEMFDYQTDQDIVDYIIENNLISSTIDELKSNITLIKQEIMQLPNPVARDTLLFATDKITGKALKKVKK